MASRIITKKGSGAPLASDLVHGELAVDTVNKRLYTENAGGTVIEVGTSPSTIDINAGTIDGTVIGGSSAAAGTFTTVTASGDVTLSGGTANGVAFANGSKVLTTGSALTFDGTNLGLTGGEIRWGAGPVVGALSYSGGAPVIASIGNIPILFYTNSAEQMRLNATGLGIGTTSPSSILETVGGDGITISNSGDTFLQLKTTGTTATNYIEFKDATGSAGSLFYNHTSNYLAAKVNNAERLRIDSSGNMGIGTSSPRAKAEVYDSSVSGAFNAADLSTWRVMQVRNNIEGVAGTAAGIALGGDGSSDTKTAGIVGISDNTTGGACQLAFLTATGNNSVERMRITSSGNVGIGTTSPGGALTVASSGGAGVSIAQSNENFYAGSLHRFYDLSYANERMRIDSSGNLLVGTTTGSSRLKVLGAVNSAASEVQVGTNGYAAINFLNASGSQQGYIVTNASSVSLVSVSDQRLKENITDANDAGDKIDAIQVRQYDWKADGSHQDYGMVAQELMAVAPEAVSGDPDSDEMMGVDYSKLVPMLVKEIQSLRARVAQLEN